MNKIKNAIDSFSREIKSGPTADLHLLRAKSYAVLGDVHHALEDIRRAIELEPDHKEAYDDLALAHLKNGDFSAAEKAAEKAHSINPHIAAVNWMVAREGNRLTRKISDAPTAALHNKRGLLSLYQGALIPAKADFEAAVKMDREFDDAYANLAQTLLKLALPQEAEKVLDDISDRHPAFKHDNILLAKKWAFLELKVNHSPTAETYKDLAKICVEQETIHAWEKAQLYYDKARELDEAAIAPLVKMY